MIELPVTQAEIVSACARWRSRLRHAVTPATARAVIVGLYELHGFRPPAVIDVCASPLEFESVLWLRRGHDEPSDPDEDDLGEALWRVPLSESVLSVELVLRVRRELAGWHGGRAAAIRSRIDARVAERFDSPKTVLLPSPRRAPSSEVPASWIDVLATAALEGAPSPAAERVLDACERLSLSRTRAVVSLHPEVEHIDDEGRYHRVDGPAVRWRDGTEAWVWHGHAFDPLAIAGPEHVRRAAIRASRPARLRGVLIDRFGLGAYMLASGARRVDWDACGELYRLEQDDHEPIVAVRVLDRVRDAIGGPREHWLRVPPQISVARAAVAWTFRVEPARYRPRVES